MITFFGLYGFSQERIVVRFENPTKEILKQYSPENYDVAAYKPGSFLDIVTNQEGFNKIKELGFDVKIVQTEAQLSANLKTDLNGYRSYDELLTELQQIEFENPGICKLYDIGDTRGKEYSNGGNANYNDYNQEVWALKVSDNVETEEDEPCVYFFGEHHAREPISLEVAMYVLNHIVDNYQNDPTITDQINNTQIWFVPLVNPNGHKLVIDEFDLMWRKNIRDNNGNGQIDPGGYWDYPDGVDPNRNYSFMWGGQGAGADPGEQTYRGPSATSEPEIQATQSLISSHHFVTGITYHSYSELVLYPFGYSSNIYAPDLLALKGLAEDMAATIPGLYGGNYTPEASWELYPCSGTTDDYSYGEHGVFSYTVELGVEFIPPANQILPICQDNLEAALIILNRVNKSTLTGHITDASTDEVLVAEIYIDGIDNTGVFREPYESDEDFGRYYRLLTDGNFDVTFSTYGYIPQTFENININSMGITQLDASLVPAESISVSGNVTDGDTGLPLENVMIEVQDVPVDPVLSNANGNYVFDEVMEGGYTFRAYLEGYGTILTDAIVTQQNNVVDFVLYETNAESFETGVFSDAWQFGGNAPWTISTQDPYDGEYCAKSGSIGDYSTSETYITLDLLSGGNISFFRKVSSEENYDYLEFYIDGILKDQWAGTVPWGEESFTVSSGVHTFKWVYDKDANTTGGSDCAWIDYICFPPIVPDEFTQTISLNTGYQFISTRIETENPDMFIVLADNLNDNLDFVRNSNGEVLRKIGPNWINGIGDWLTTEGYLFKMNDSDVLEITGDELNPQTPISLATGYQFISYLPSNPMDALEAYNSILNDDLVFVRDSEGSMLRKIGPNWVNGIGNCVPGNGYLIKMTGNNVLTYPQSVKTSVNNKLSPKHFEFNGGNAADPVFTIYIKGLEIGDEVAAFDGEILVGAITINSENEFMNALPIFSTLTNGNGYASGNPINLKIFSSNSNEISNADFTMEAKFNSYVENIYPAEDGEYSIVNITKGSTKSTFENLSIYPNPATDIVSIVSGKMFNKLTIVNSIGQIVFENFDQCESLSINTDGFEAGIYFIRIEYFDNILIEKLIIK